MLGLSLRNAYRGKLRRTLLPDAFRVQEGGAGETVSSARLQPGCSRAPLLLLDLYTRKTKK
jgi:hypothetical protein